MIIYVTKETAERYKLKMPEKMSSPLKELTATVIKRESGDRMLKWGAKLFYFDRRKCLQVVNFASKLTLFLIDVKVDDIFHIGNAMANYMFDIYADNPEITKLLECFFEEDGIVVFSALKDRSIISTLNRTQLEYADNGYRFYEFIENGILQTRKFNKKFNTEWLLTKKVDEKMEFFYPAEMFEQLLKARYSENS